MRQTWSNGLYRLTQFLLYLYFGGIIVGPLWIGYPRSPLEYYLGSAVFLCLSLLLFALIWRFPRLKRWEDLMLGSTLISSCLAGAYTGWVYAPTWRLLPVLGHVLGLLVGAALALCISLWESLAIAARRRSLLAGQHDALDSSGHC
jgi:hypothetical protein